MPRRLLAEFIGTAFLLAAIVGSGIHAQRLTDDVGRQLTMNVIGTAGALTALILALGPRSGAHFNPAITIADRVLGGMSTLTAALYVVAQVVGAYVGVVLANLMFDLGAVEQSENVRSGGGIFVGEAIAMFGLVLVVFGGVRSGRSHIAAFAGGGYIAAAMVFTSIPPILSGLLLPMFPVLLIAWLLTSTLRWAKPLAVVLMLRMNRPRGKRMYPASHGSSPKSR